MAGDASGRHDPTAATGRANARWTEAVQWAVVLVVSGSLVGVPAALVAEFEFGVLAALGVSGQLALGLFAMVPGFVLGGVALVVMLGS